MKFLGLILFQVVFGQAKDATTLLPPGVLEKVVAAQSKCLYGCSSGPSRKEDHISTQRCAHECHDLTAIALENEYKNVGVAPDPYFQFAREEHKLYRELDFGEKACHGAKNLTGHQVTLCVLERGLKFSTDLYNIRKNYFPNENLEVLFMEEDTVLSKTNHLCQTICYSEEHRTVLKDTAQCVVDCGLDHVTKRNALLVKYGKQPVQKDTEYRAKFDASTIGAQQCIKKCISESNDPLVRVPCQTSCNNVASVEQDALKLQYPEVANSATGPTENTSQASEKAFNSPVGELVKKINEESEKRVAALLAAEKIGADKSAADKGTADKGAADKGAADKGASDKGAAEKAAAEKAAAEKASSSDSRVVLGSVVVTMIVALFASVL